MIPVVKEFTFDAAHFLPNYDGPCKNMHGHTYKLQVGVVGAERAPLNDEGFVIDFAELKKIVKECVVGVLDHTVLNECPAPEFPTTNPTAERMVIWMATTINRNLPEDVEIKFVRLWETPTSYAEWS